ncbi:hypothetical protein NEPTK9_000779 [Candidatus Neptunochlamydia vexilliferae]|uniref:General secretion pathway GspH domain-containing protein n=2 Tax=Candidatus Neptunichlamydia vexilliferae TaxID=1651774 RepID=A0ABS0AYR1_9BACT|nr:hypothetical protein [Candidatus Neptunochlamydia vexilliferae]
MEVLLTIALIALVGSVLLFQAKPMLDHYRFTHSMGQLKRELTLSRRIARIAAADVEFSIKEKKGGGLECVRETDEPLTLPLMFDSTITIPYLHLEGREIKIIFTPSGAAFDDPVLTLSLYNQKEILRL